jgi:hypothetical protein
MTVDPLLDADLRAIEAAVAKLRADADGYTKAAPPPPPPGPPTFQNVSSSVVNNRLTVSYDLVGDTAAVRRVGLGVGYPGGFIGFTEIASSFAGVGRSITLAASIPAGATSGGFDLLQSTATSGAFSQTGAFHGTWQRDGLPPPPPPPPPTEGQFNITADGSITDPDGANFIAQGTNCTGGDSYGWGDEYNPIGKSGLWQGWGMNCVRHVHYAHVSGGNHPSTVHYSTTDALIDEFTARKMVVILDNHEGQLGDPSGKDQGDIDAAIAFFVPLATKYKANPYVWFELFNEPEQEDYFGPPPHHWVDYHAAVAAAIRATGNTSMILCCPTQFGQDAGADTTTDAQSAILQFGAELVSRFGPRVGFSPHIYSRWSSANNIAGDQSLINRFAAYRAAGFAIVVTECGAFGGGIPGDADAAHRLFRINPTVGITPWMAGTLAPPGNDVWPEFWGWAAGR